MSHQLQEEGGSADIHLELVAGTVGRTFVGDQCRIEIHILHNTSEVIFGSCPDISTNTQCEFSLSVGQYKAWSLRFVETREACFVHYPDNLVSGFVCRYKHHGVRFFIFDDYFFLGMCRYRQESQSE